MCPCLWPAVSPGLNPTPSSSTVTTNAPSRRSSMVTTTWSACECFLALASASWGDPIQDQSLLGWGFMRKPIVDDDLLLRVPLFRMLAESGRESLLLEDRWSQLEHQRAELRDRLTNHLAKLRYLRRLSGVGELAAEDIELQRDDDEQLQGIVVDVARDPASLVLLRADQMRQQPLAILTRCLQPFEAVVKLAGPLDYAGFERQVLREELVAKPTVLHELLAVVLEQPRVVQGDCGLQRKLLDHRNGPPTDPFALPVPFDHQHAEANPPARKSGTTRRLRAPGSMDALAFAVPDRLGAQSCGVPTGVSFGGIDPRTGRNSCFTRAIAAAWARHSTATAPTPSAPAPRMP